MACRCTESREDPDVAMIFESADRLCIWPLALNEQVDGSLPLVFVQYPLQE
jgi:hypothetical protein